MSYIPDCRDDENYNEKYLNDKDAEFIAGFDWCRIMAVDNFFDNIDMYTSEFDQFDNPEMIEKAVRFVEMLEEEALMTILKDCILHYIEMQRDQLITSMIDNMDDEEWETIKAEVDAGKRKNCIQTYAFEKEDRGENPEV